MASNEQLKLAHVLFIDIVGYSRLLNDEQRECLQTLNQIIRASVEFRRADESCKLKRLPTGDGVALVLFTSPDAPAECAVEISSALKQHPELRVRMGIHTGPVNDIIDLNEQSNVAGGGINMAQRVMDCADAGHILMSKRVAEDLGQYRQWQPYLHDLGEVEVKHGVTVQLVNFYGEDFGNPAPPDKCSRAAIVAASATAALLIGAGMWLLTRAPKPAASPSQLDKSIAVLPFENLSRDPDNAYFAEGIQDEILTRLAKIADLKVISRTSTSRYKSSPDNLPEIAKQLGVANILEGSVQKTGDSVRVNVQLINAGTDAHLWAETYDRKVSEIFEFQSDIAQRVASALEAKLTGREGQQIASSAATENPRAYEAYLRGLALDVRGANTSGDRDAFREAVELDPEFAAAWAALANREAFEYFQVKGTPEQLGRARDAMEMALRLAPDASESHAAATSFYYYCLQDFDRALEYAAEARRRAPNDAHVILLTALVKRRQGKFDEAIELLHEAAKLDPRNNDIWLSIGRSERGARRFDGALTYFDRALAIAPGEPAIVGEKAFALLAAGDLERVEQLLKSVPRTDGSIASHSYVSLLIYRRAFDRAAEITSQVLRNANPERLELFLPRIALARIEILRGNREAGLQTMREIRGTLEERKRGGDRSVWIRSELILLAAMRGAREAVEREGAELLRMTENDKWSFPESQETLARGYALLGDADRAIPLLGRLLQETYHLSLSTADLRLNPEWDSIRNDPRFQQLAQETAP
ncbi:MAG: tetratricopeptide repeat protein [Chthoniobacterales bacterium]|nr:tetratricopeptide repeat protein [Chthoniobacterales bacterium]